MAWLMANWKEVLLVILGIDSAILPLFPSNGVLLKIKDILMGLAK